MISDERVLAQLDLDEGQSAVRVSHELVDRAFELGVDMPWLRVLASDDLVVVGTTACPEDVLLSRPLPVGERIVIPVRRPSGVAA